MELRLNFRKDDWCTTGVRALENGIALVGVPAERLEELVAGAEEAGLPVEVEAEGDRWRVEPEGGATA